MKNLKKKEKKFTLSCLLILSVFMVLSSNSQINLNININKKPQFGELDNLNQKKIPNVAWFNNSHDPIYIDGNTAQNWAWAETQPFCQKGDGSWGNPYVIENITINCKGIGSGIYINNSKTVYFTIQNCTITGSSSNAYEAGIKLENTCNGTVFNNTCFQNGGNGIILHNNCNNNTIENNILNNNGNMGISLRASDENRINNNTIKNNHNSGIYLYAGSDKNNITNNICYNDFGINNENQGIYLDGGILGCMTNIIENNTCINNIEYGIHLYANCFNNKIINNTINNSSWGCHVDWNSDNTEIRNNTICSINGIYIGYLTHNVDIYGNKLKKGGILIFGLDHPYSYLLSIDLQYNTIDGKHIYRYIDKTDLRNINFTNYGDPGQIMLINCSNSIISDWNLSGTTSPISLYYCTNISLYNNSVDNSYYGIYLVASDYNNVTENNANNGRSVGIYLSAGFGSEAGSDNNTLSGNKVDNNNDYGIYLRVNCDNNTLTRNIANNNNNYGIYLNNDCDNNTITGNKAIENLIYGICIYDNSGNNTILGNIFRNSGSVNIYDQCIDNIYAWNVLDWDLTDPIIIDNIGAGDFTLAEAESNLAWVTGSGTINDPYIFENVRVDVSGTGSGIIIENSNKFLTIQNCTVYNSDSSTDMGGIKLISTSNATIINCSLYNNSNGIFLTSNCYYNNILNNVITNNTNIGIKLELDCYFNNINGNIIVNNTNIGLSLYSACSNNTIAINTIEHNKIGVDISGFSNNNTFFENQIINNLNLGVGIHKLPKVSCYYNIFYGNTFNNPQGINAMDNCSTNKWDYGKIGNSWQDYVGRDANDDGIGDTPYNISGTGGAQDKYPIYSDRQDIFPPNGDDNDYEEGTTDVIGGVIIIIIIAGIAGAIGLLYWMRPEEVKAFARMAKDTITDKKQKIKEVIKKMRETD